MATVKTVERKIRKVDGFDVVIRHRDGSDVRGDLRGLPTYPYKRALSEDATASSWIKGRFSKVYPGYQVDVIDGEGNPVKGNSKLKTVRGTYEEA